MNVNKPWFSVPIPEWSVRSILKRSGLTPSDEIDALDFGCGAGRYLDAFRKIMPNARFLGVEVDEEAIQIARAIGLNVCPLQPDRAEIPCPDEAFDFVFSSNVIEHIPKPLYRAYIPELARVLKKNGVLFIGAPNYPIKRVFDVFKAMKAGPLWKYYLFDDPTHVNRVSVCEVEKDLKKYFADIKMEGSEYFFHGTYPLAKHEWARRHLRIAAYKFTGTARKLG